jgi:hypothetical protein
MSKKSEKKSWKEKLVEESPSHGKIVKILIPKPLDVDSLIRTVPEGKLVTDKQIREKLANEYEADATCSKVTGIFVRIAAEAAEEDLQAGITKIAPYWRVLAKDGSLKPKFPGGIEHQKELLEKEGHTIIQKGKKFLVLNFEEQLTELQ